MKEKLNKMESRMRSHDILNRICKRENSGEKIRGNNQKDNGRESSRIRL